MEKWVPTPMAQTALGIFELHGEDNSINYVEDLATERYCGDLQPHAVFPDGSGVTIYPKAKKIEFTYHQNGRLIRQYRSLVNV